MKIHILLDNQNAFDSFNVPPENWLTAPNEDGEYGVVDRNNVSNYKVYDYPPIDIGEIFGESEVVDIAIKKLDNGLIVWEITLASKEAYQYIQVNSLNDIRDVCHKAAENWWVDLKTGQDLRIPNDDGSLKFNIPEKLCLIHSEISEAMEGYRKNLNDDHLPHRKMFDVELADAVIRIMDLCGALNIDIGNIVKEKLAYNSNRVDHKPENRKKENGKGF